MKGSVRYHIIGASIRHSLCVFESNIQHTNRAATVGSPASGAVSVHFSRVMPVERDGQYCTFYI